MAKPDLNARPIGGLLRLTLQQLKDRGALAYAMHLQGCGAYVIADTLELDIAEVFEHIEEGVKRSERERTAEH